MRPGSALPPAYVTRCPSSARRAGQRQHRLAARNGARFALGSDCRYLIAFETPEVRGVRRVMMAPEGTKRELRIRLRERELIAELGSYALRSDNLDGLLQEASRLIAE